MTVMEQVKRVCFSMDIESRKELHRNLLNVLQKLFVEGGYIVYLEYPLRFDSKSRKSREQISRKGNVDLAAVKQGRKIAIEFDTGINLKFKSIEKLFQIDADLCIGIVRGRSGSLDFSIERLKESARDFNLTGKNFWLISLSERKICKPVLNCKETSFGVAEIRP